MEQVDEGKTILAIESSCDETAVAILRNGQDLLAGLVSSQMELHARFGGVVPEVASRNHLLAAPVLVEEALQKAGIDLKSVDAFAATTGPGLAAALMIGTALAKGLALASGKPFLAVNHMEGHLLSPFFGKKEIPPHLALIVSGGHTLLVNVKGVGDYTIAGRTLDDAAGEAFDKVAKLIGLGYPGGPIIDQMAEGGNPARYSLPRGMRDSGDYQFSFSGLKTAVRYLLEKEKNISQQDLCASFQEAVVEVLVHKALAAARHFGHSRLAVSGGVSCNRRLRSCLSEACRNEGIELHFAEPWLSTDNAAMIAFAAALRLAKGETSDIGKDISPNFSTF
ncbi:MAG: tRNA (adenosine(37)-N6)-threonylcarbamoyltransferase complex transferase subunit TsaD [Chthoniobacterales bacterium]